MNTRLAKIQETVRSALENTHSSFYRDLYKGKIPDRPDFPASWEEWQSIPLLQRSDIARAPFHDRLFLPIEEIHTVRTTSGTSASGALVFPRSAAPVPDFEEAFAKSKTILTFFVPHHMVSSLLPNACVIGGDAARLHATAVLASQAGVDALHGSPALILAFAPILSTYTPLEKIKTVMTSMDRCTRLQERTLAKLFPNAKHFTAYGSTEQQGYGALTARTKILGHPGALEATTDYLYELIDESGHNIHEPTVPGEIVTTTLGTRRAFPIIRYRTGDKAVMLGESDRGLIFEILGRSEGDRIRVTGGEIVLVEIERVLLTLDIPLTDFDATIDDASESQPIPQLTLTLYMSSPAPDIDLKVLTRNIADELRVNEERSYADGVKKGLYAPLACNILPLHKSPQGKRKRLHDARA